MSKIKRHEQFEIWIFLCYDKNRYRNWTYIITIYNIKSFYKKVPNSIQKSSINPLKIWIKKAFKNSNNKTQNINKYYRSSSKKITDLNWAPTWWECLLWWPGSATCGWRAHIATPPLQSEHEGRTIASNNRHEYF